MNEKIKAYYVADDIDKVLNYIDNLEQENKKLKAELQLYQGALKREHEAIHRVNDLEEVIDKAIDLIESKNNGHCIINGEEKEAFTFLLDFDKAIEYIKENDEPLYINDWNSTYDGTFYDCYVEIDFTKKILDILKEVE